MKPSEAGNMAGVKSRGKLTVFLGAAPGVGKTHSMLLSARQRLTAGVDVVAANVDVDHQPECHQVLMEIPTVNMDLDAILSRAPSLVLVDRLAHLNGKTSRHVHRYQDVLEMLDAGIDVYATIGVQHLHSLSDIAAHITGVKVGDTVPDHIVESASQVVVVDSPTEWVLERLGSGLVRISGMSSTELRKLLRPGNLYALRELTLRWAMEHVDRHLRDYMTEKLIPGPWAARERILVAVGPSPFSEYLIKVAHRMATSLAAPWIAAYVETSQREDAYRSSQDRVTRALQLAEESGAETIVIHAQTIESGLVRLARERNATQIVIGKPLRPAWRQLIGGSFVDRIINRVDNIAVHVIPESRETDSQRQDGPSEPRYRRRHPTPILWSILSVVTLTGALLPLQPHLDPMNMALLYLLPVLLAARTWGLWPAIAASFAGVLTLDLFYIPPLHRFGVQDARYFLTFAIFLGVATLTSRLAGSLGDKIEAIRQRQMQMAVLHRVSREMTALTDIGQIADIVTRNVMEVFDYPCVVLLPDEDEALTAWPQSARLTLAERVDDEAARWTLAHGERSGKGTETLPNTRGFYLPMKANQRAVGVLGIISSSGYGHVGLEQRQLLESLADLAALALERAALAREAESVRWVKASEHLYSSVFNSVSHELRTPLSMITAAVTSLLDESTSLGQNLREEMLETIREEASRMNRLLQNLLNMARLESGAMKPSRDWTDLRDVIHAAVSRIERFARERRVAVSLPDVLPLVEVDDVLLEQVLLNLLDNAAKYSPPGTPIQVEAKQEGDSLLITVADEGPGATTQDLPRLFEKFFRAQDTRANRGGTGLGLSICKGIVEAHGGRIWAENRLPEGHGLVVSVSLNVPRIYGSVEGSDRRNGRESAR